MAYCKSFRFFIMPLNAVARSNEFNLRLVDTGQLTCPHEARPLRRPGTTRTILAITSDLLPSLSYRWEDQVPHFSLPRVPAASE